MAGLRPGHPRLSCLKCCKDVDARHKAGHDELGLRGASLKPVLRNLANSQIRFSRFDEKPHRRSQ
jgi:hypothetical protein